MDHCNVIKPLWTCSSGNKCNDNTNLTTEWETVSPWQRSRMFKSMIYKFLNNNMLNLLTEKQLNGKNAIKTSEIWMISFLDGFNKSEVQIYIFMCECVCDQTFARTENWQFEHFDPERISTSKYLKWFSYLKNSMWNVMWKKIRSLTID